MAQSVYALCTITSIICAAMLYYAHRKDGLKLTLYMAICFTGLALNNFLLVADKYIFPNVDLSVWRLIPALVGISALVYVLVMEDI